jgi:hypothetical protein
VLGCLIWRMPCYNMGRCKVFLVCVFSRVWNFGQIHGRCINLTNETMIESYRFRCSSRLKRRPHVGIGQEWDFWG